jgi:hypothetical protein
MRTSPVILLISLALGLGGSGAVAQSTTPTPVQSPPGTDPSSGRNDCQPSARDNAPTLGKDNSGKSLSDQLAQSKGVICPPSGVDPQMAAPPPGGGKTPVIRPPGSPGGDQNVQPK